MNRFSERILLLITLLYSSSCTSGAVSTEIPYTPTPSLSSSPTATPEILIFGGNLENQIARLEEYMPLARSEDFVIPTKAEQSAFSEMIFALGDGKVDSVPDQDLIQNYELIHYTDHGDKDSKSYLLREKLPIQKGWGLYVFRMEPSNNIIIEAPHPLADKRTPRIALDLYRALNARALLIAGAHRDANKNGSADSAHASKTIFQTVHLALYQETRNLKETAVFLQIHGFAADNHPEYPQVVLGYNWEDDPEKDLLLQNIVDAMRYNEIEVGVCNGDAYQNLCGKNNVQGLVIKDGIFIHVELNESIRRDDSALVEALKQVLGQ
jgi:hypothetical protein